MAPATLSAAAEARGYYERGDFTRAKALFQAQLESFGDTPSNLLHLARIAYREGDWEAVERWTDRLLAIEPDHSEGLLMRGRLLNHAGDWAAAAGLWERLSNLRKTDPEPPLQWARALAQTGRPSESAEVMQEVLRRDANHVAALKSLGEWHLSRSEFAELPPIVTRLIEQDPTAAVDLASRVEKVAGLGDRLAVFLAAAGAMTEEVRSATLDRLLRLIEFKEALGEHEEAVGAFQRILQIDPNNARAASGVSRTSRAIFVDVAQSFNARDYATCKAKAKLLVIGKLPHPQAGLYLARAGEAVEDWESVREGWLAVLQTEPSAANWLRYARACERSQLLDAAVDACARALALERENQEIAQALARMVRMLLYLGRERMSQGDLEAADAAFRAILRVQPDHDEATRRRFEIGRKRVQILRTYFKETKFADCVRLGEQITQLIGDQVDVHLIMARSFWNLHDYGRSRDAWREVAELSPESFDAWLNLARCAARLGEREEAEKYSARALSLSPAHAEAQELLERFGSREA